MKTNTRFFAITGNIGTGKSTVAWMFEDLGVPVLYADEIAHEAIAPHTATWETIFGRYGRAIILNDNIIDRKKLAGIIFDDPDERKFLESLIHPFVHSEIKRRAAKLAKEKHPFVIAEIPLLYEVGWENDFDGVIVVRCDDEKEIKRCQEKFDLNREDAIKRMAAQYPLERKIESADIVIDNDGPIEETKVQVKRLYQDMVKGKFPTA